jgi:hypothetical protein
VIAIQAFTNLDWFRFHGKQYVTEQLQQEGFYDIKISRKMNLEEGASFIRITGICLSVKDGAVYGSISIYKDRIEHDGSFAAIKMSNVIQHNQHVYYYNGVKKSKSSYIYKQKNMIF